MLSLEPKKTCFDKKTQLSTLHRNFISTKKVLHPGKPTWIPKMMLWKRWFLLNMAIFGIYVRFLGVPLPNPKNNQPVVLFQGLSTNPLGFPLHLSKVFGYPGAQRWMDSMDAGEGDHQKGKPPKNIWLFKKKSRKSWYKYRGCDLFWWFSCLLVLARNGCWYLF